LVTKKLGLGIGIMVGLLAVTGTVLSPANLAWAKTILCTGPAECFGTHDDDTMVGDNGPNQMGGFEGNDNLSGKDGGDFAGGFEGDDIVSGGKGNDALIGNTGADKLVGGEGNDKIFHADANSVDPDGSKDIIDCGSGIDEVWLNQRTDGDTASGCEILHTGP
jgi:Ca2+-binding RTX toxin-like protein